MWVYSNNIQVLFIISILSRAAEKIYDKKESPRSWDLQYLLTATD